MSFAETDPLDSLDGWSEAIALGSDLARLTISIPGDVDREPLPLVLTVQRAEGTNFVAVSVDATPQLLIVNELSVSVSLRQVIDGMPYGRACCLSAQRLTYWQLPSTMEAFPAASVASTAPIHQVVFCIDGAETWSEPINIMSCGIHELSNEGEDFALRVTPGAGCSRKVCIASKESLAAVKIDTAVHQSINISARLSQVRVLLFDGINEELQVSIGLLLDRVTADLEVGEEHKASLSVDSVQVENLMREDQIDFPVVLSRHVDPISERAKSFLHSSSPALKNTQAALCLSVNLTNDGFPSQVDVSLAPLAVNVEDGFIEQLGMLKTWSAVAAPEATNVDVDPTWKQVRLWRLPPKLEESLVALMRPLRVGTWQVSPVQLMLTVHASAKLFLSVDRSPLSLDAFQVWPCITTAGDFSEAVSLHYVSSGLTGLGWLVSSLDFLGAPGSFVRSVGAGLHDLVKLPYEGLTRGPGSFVAGVGGGTASLLRHVSAGALTSMSRFAASAARNLDGLSLDSEHAREQLRHRRNTGAGLRSGLHNFGLAWLGAVAGLADHPLRPFLRPQEVEEGSEKPSSISLIGASLAGVGKGLVGVVTKPVSGAMDLIAQTGQGVLQSMDLVLLPECRLGRQILVSDQLAMLRLVFRFKLCLSRFFILLLELHVDCFPFLMLPCVRGENCGGGGGGL